MQALSDEELMVHAQAGHHDALALIVSRYQRLVWGLAAKIVHDPGEAEDVVQIVFADLFQKMALFDPSRGTLKVWLMQFAYSRSINRRYYLQRRQFYNQAKLEELDIAQSTSSTIATLALERSETARLVRETLALLPTPQRTAIEMIHMQGLTFEEVAQRSGQTIAAAKHHYYRGMARLRECIMAKPTYQEPAKEAQAMTGWEIAHARPQSI
ncbi:MAG TPA: sigma-70 family RNA polymerase sigma factor [Terriglobales bacterium]|nr:sigma-70 family RNA polymerase sigma factor [Terriglobales bacterium]